MTRALESAIIAASGVDFRQAAELCGFEYREDGEGALLLARFLGAEVGLAVPAFEQTEGEPIPPHVLAIIAYHLATSSGAEPSGRWIAFNELPDGAFYVDAYRGYTGSVLVRRFGNDIAAVERATEAIGGKRIGLPGDVAVLIPVMPRLPMALVYWAGDEEFEPRADFLFDSTAPEHLVTDCLAVCCSWITHRLVAASGT